MEGGEPGGAGDRERQVWVMQDHEGCGAKEPGFCFKHDKEGPREVLSRGVDLEVIPSAS